MAHASVLVVAALLAATTSSFAQMQRPRTCPERCADERKLNISTCTAMNGIARRTSCELEWEATRAKKCMSECEVEEKAAASKKPSSGKAQQ
jgi:hypothetical protein